MLLPNKIHLERNRSGFYHPVAILVLAAITLTVAIIFYLNANVLFKDRDQQEPTSTAPSVQTEVMHEDYFWKTYTSQNFKISIKYPEEFTPNEEVQQIIFSKGIASFSVNVASTELKNTNDLQLNYNSKITKIGNYEFLVSYDDVATDSVGNTYSLVNNGQLYTINFSAGLPEMEIISSLKIGN